MVRVNIRGFHRDDVAEYCSSDGLRGLLLSL